MIGPKLERPTAAEGRAARAAVRKRSGGICEGCGKHPATDQHHRLYKSRLGYALDTEDNLLDLCGGASGLAGGNHSGCHGVAHTLIGEHLGWSVKSGNDPAEVPVFHKATITWTLSGKPILPALSIDLLVALGQLRQGVSA